MLTVLLTVAACALLIVTRSAPVGGQFAFRGWDIPVSLAFGIVGALMSAKRPRNPVGWLMAAAGAVSAFGSFGAHYATLSLTNHDGGLPLTDFIGWIQNSVWVVILGLGIILPMLLFPNGALLSKRWRPVLWASIAAIPGFTLTMAVDPADLSAIPLGVPNPYAWSEGAAAALNAIFGPLFTGSLVACAVSLVKRYRRSTGVEREQMRWLSFAGSVMGITFGIGAPMFLVGMTEGLVLNIVEVAIVLAIAGIPIATGIAILRHRLLDIDVVISKAVVFGTLAAGITALYVGIVAGIGALVGRRDEPSLELSVAATAAVALAVQPLRTWAQRVANRFVYGRRATPHEVLTVLGSNIAGSYSLDDVLPRLAQLTTEATAASHARVWVRIGTELHAAAAWPPDDAAPAAIAAHDAIPMNVPGADHVFPVRHQDETLGAIAVITPHSEPLTATDERLLADLASHAGLLLRNIRLLEELRASRQRLVAAQDHERRRIERDLHDGAQQELVALKVQAGLARSLMSTDAEQAEAMLADITEGVSRALESLRDLARGIYPPMLASSGLVTALRSQAEKSLLPVAVDGDGIGRYPMEVESAIYFCVLEALQNIAKYARPTTVRVWLTETDGRLEFTVTDDGAGFDVAKAKRGSGTQNMTDRVEALGGGLRIDSQPGAGTTVHGWLPAPVSSEESPAPDRQPV